jgi:hypothetical protein
MSDAALVQLSRAQQALVECKTAMDAKSIADQAEALRVWAERAHASIDTVNRAVEVKIHAERRMGELLAQQPKAHAGRPAKEEIPRESRGISTPTLRDMGISYDESARAQKLAALPADEVAGRIALAKADGGRLSTAKVLAPAVPVRRKGTEESEEGFRKRLGVALRMALASVPERFRAVALELLRSAIEQLEGQTKGTEKTTS